MPHLKSQRYTHKNSFNCLTHPSSNHIIHLETAFTLKIAFVRPQARNQLVINTNYWWNNMITSRPKFLALHPKVEEKKKESFPYIVNLAWRVMVPRAYLSLSVVLNEPFNKYYHTLSHQQTWEDSRLTRFVIFVSFWGLKCDGCRSSSVCWTSTVLQ